MPSKSKFLKLMQNRVAQFSTTLVAFATITTTIVNWNSARLQKEILDKEKECEDRISKIKQTNIIIEGIKIEDLIEELAYLRYFADYNIALGKYQQNATDDRKALVVYTTQRLAEFVKEKRKKLIKGTGDNPTIQLLVYSSDEIKFESGKRYAIPEDVLMFVNKPNDIKLEKNK